MTDSGPHPPPHGARFEFSLRHIGADGAVYDTWLHREGRRIDAAVAITARGHAAFEGDAPVVDPPTAEQWLSLAKTLGRHVEDGHWPRRVLRWRQAGVR